MSAEVHRGYVPLDTGLWRFGVFEVDVSGQTETN